MNFEEVVLTGLAVDGGLYVPESLPRFSEDDIRAWRGLSYDELAFHVMWPFVKDTLTESEFKGIIERAYASFRHAAIAPLVQTAHNEWVLELFQGPTLAFKDFALQFLGQLLDFLLARRDQKVVVMGATSGDTGSAAIEGCRRCNNIDIFILHPHQRVSEVQRRQMTTVISDNVFNIAVKGNFDDCQNIVKASFRDQGFLPEGQQLVAVNSINWARIMAQIVYYFYSALAVGSPDRKVSFSVPTGNFGDIFAGYLAMKMGLPIDQLVVATNQNDILHRCLSANDHSKQALQKSLSPSMDIMVSSNFERLLFDLYHRDGAEIRRLLQEFEQGTMALSDSALSSAKEVFASHRLNDEQTLNTIKKVHADTEYTLDPHTAIGVAAARYCRSNQVVPMICLATAHPAKFPEAYANLSGVSMPPLPAHFHDLREMPERYDVIENDAAIVQTYMRDQLR